MKKFACLIFPLILISALLSCEEEALPSGIVLNIYNDSTSHQNDSTGSSAGLIFSKAMIGLIDVELENKEEHDQEAIARGEDVRDLVEYEGPYKIDLITNSSAPELGQRLLKSGNYHDLELKLGRTLNGNKTIDLHFEQNGKKFEISSASDTVEIELIRPEKFKLTQNKLSRLLVVVNLHLLIQSTDLTNAVTDADGIVRINEESNNSVMIAFLKALFTAVDAGKDDNRDGKID